MKKLLTGIVITAAMSSLAFACGGMTQIDPPAMSGSSSTATSSVDSVVDDMDGIVVLC